MKIKIFAGLLGCLFGAVIVGFCGALRAVNKIDLDLRVD